MTSFLRLLAAGVLGLVAVAMVSIPPLISADIGGILPWTQLLGGYAMTALVIASVAAAPWSELTTGKTARWLLLPAGIWVGWLFFQTISLPASVIGWLSPASADARLELVGKLGNQFASTGSTFPISIMPEWTIHVAAMAVITLGVLWLSIETLNARSRLSILLMGVSIACSVLSAYGIVRVVLPDFDPFLIVNREGSFSTFTNRNNAAFFLNLGLASSLGLLAWRLMALCGVDLDDDSFELNDLMSLVGDRESIFGVVGLVMCGSGLLICGSRGGLVAGIVASVVAFGWGHQRRGRKLAVVVAVTLIVSALLLFLPFQLDFRSWTRLSESSSGDLQSVREDGRWTHWQDAVDAFVGYAPAGSGGGSYAWAHLPFQDQTSNHWFRHADNLWLEIAVEGGVVAVICVLALFALVVTHLRRLQRSTEPCDHGLRVTGWFVLAMVLVSQTFDFGLIWPGNLWTTVAIMGAVAARGSLMAGVTPGGIRFKRRFGWAMPTATGIVMASSMLAVWPLLHRSAEVDALASEIRDVVRDQSEQAEALEAVIERSDVFLSERDSARVREAVLPARFQLARIREASKISRGDPRKLVRTYNATAPNVRRLTWSQHDDPVSPEASELASLSGVSDAYDRVLDDVVALLRLNPLSFEARRWLLYTDFHHRDASSAREALRQMSEFFAGDASSQLQLARYAASSDDHQLAIDLLTESFALDPKTIVDWMRVVDAYPSLDWDLALPDNSDAYRLFAPSLLERLPPIPDGRLSEDRIAMVRRVTKGMACQLAPSVAERLRCHTLAGELSYRIGDDSESVRHFTICTQLAPTDANFRLQLIRRLRETGKTSEALRIARQCRIRFPQDQRFDGLIQRYAAEDRRD